ncbi:MAG: hypothetical protein U0517_00145 [Candidatus Andersenbacteria bacterium]
MFEDLYPEACHVLGDLGGFAGGEGAAAGRAEDTLGDDGVDALVCELERGSVGLGQRFWFGNLGVFGEPV